MIEFDEALREIFDPPGLMGRRPSDWEGHKGWKSKVKRVKALIRKSLPEKEKPLSTPPLHDYEDGEIVGWNQAIDKTVKRMGLNEKT